MEERTSKCLGDWDDTASARTGWQHGGSDQCPARQIFDRVGNRWSLYVMAHLASETLRFNEIRRRIEGLSQRVLTVTLRSLERDGLVTRTQYPTIPPQGDYRLTPFGRSLLESVRQLVAWAETNQAETLAHRASFDGRGPLDASPGAANHQEAPR